MRSPRSIDEIEALIREHQLVHTCIVVGDEQPYYSVLLSPDRPGLDNMLGEKYPESKYNLNTHAGMNHIDIRSHYCDLLEDINAVLGEKRIERFTLVELDPRKTRETIIAENKLIIDSLYQEYIAGVG